MNHSNDNYGETNNTFSGGQAENVFQAQNIGEVNFSVQQGTDTQEIVQRFAGRWQEDIETTDELSILWDFGLNGRFSARHLPGHKRRLRLNFAVQEWWGDWHISLHPKNSRIELLATDLNSPGLQLVSSVFGQPEQKRDLLSRLTRTASFTSNSFDKFTLDWLDLSGTPTKSAWNRCR
ncbi:hypothetical protein [Streptomyces sp. IB2014 016-6]|uniref:hypothetical protein n=1 Tax=Streptomyces sp. IB2014 016-6 TaxID=2517818 RepID=UPI0011CABC79|nr:hypothetical protein [Streptomyces sp. IB2014 016-6]TXL86915.1 hypothetical protein EW053_25055 [Streptomyces sp. IB2014 016-6]